MSGTALSIFIVNKDGSGATEALHELLRNRTVISNVGIAAAVIYPEGTSGKTASVALLIKLPNGDVVHAETTGKIINALAGAIAGVELRKTQPSEPSH